MGSVVVVPGLWSTGSVVAAHEFSCSTGLWDLPRLGIEPVSPALASGFFTTEPPGKPQDELFKNEIYSFHKQTFANNVNLF